MFTRRDGLKWTLALAATAVAAARPGLFSPACAAAEPTFKVPPLGYEFEALEPYIDTATMTIHHDRHHAAYSAALNGLVEKYPGLATTLPVAILTDFTIVPETLRAPVRNNLGGHWNHSFFWELMIRAARRSLSESCNPRSTSPSAHQPNSSQRGRTRAFRRRLRMAHCR